MTRLLPFSLLVFGYLNGCSPRSGINSDCQWPPDSRSGRLDLSRYADRKHLNRDAEIAEDLAIRYADVRRWRGTGRGDEGFHDYGRARDGCMAAMFHVVAASHGVSDEQVRRSLANRPNDFDLGVLLSFGVLYGWGVLLIVRWFSRSYGRDATAAAKVVMEVFLCAAMATAGVMICEQWSIIAESYRLGNGHLSYRTFRLPWGHNRLPLLVAGAVLFWVVHAIQRSGVGRKTGGMAPH